MSKPRMRLHATCESIEARLNLHRDTLGEMLSAVAVEAEGNTVERIEDVIDFLYEDTAQFMVDVFSQIPQDPDAT